MNTQFDLVDALKQQQAQLRRLLKESGLAVPHKATVQKLEAQVDAPAPRKGVAKGLDGRGTNSEHVLGLSQPIQAVIRLGKSAQPTV